MCGIVAYISRKKRPVDKRRLLGASRMMGHRGPDHQGLFMNDWIGMAHNRLAIIDLSPEARQPMFSRDRRYVIVYNGETYNYKTLREELVKEGFNFRTRSDTEVVLNSYIRYSTGCVKKLRGMFAFAIADLQEKEVFIARDCFGIKPLYVNISDDHILLSSEVKPMSKFIRLAPDYTSFTEQIMFRDTAGKRTCFKGVERLAAGSFCLYRLDKDAFKEEEYYGLDTTFRNKIKAGRLKDEESIIEEAEEILTEAVRVHTYSDVGYNLQLSGGVDSSLIAAILSKKLNLSGLRSYSVVLEDGECDESSYQDMVTKRYGIEKKPIEISNGIYTDNLERAVYFIEKPVVHPGSVCLYHLTKESVTDSKVMLTGEGADEAFGGYNRYNTPYRLGILKWLRGIGAHKVMRPFKDMSGTLSALYTKIEGNQLLEYTSLYAWRDLEKLLNKDVIEKRDLFERESLLAAGPFRNLRESLLYYDQKTYLATLLDRQDKLSMANSVEARVPYIDKRLYEFANSLPARLKFKDGQLKYVLRKVAERHLPPELIYRRKNGLNLPLREWFRDKRLLGRYLDMLLDGVTRGRNIYNMDYLEYMVDAERKNTGGFTVKLAMLVNLELWHRIFFDKTIEVVS